jgi:hypothetical protein
LAGKINGGIVENGIGCEVKAHVPAISKYPIKS